MKDVIFLVCDLTKVVKMTKSPPSLRRGEIVVRLDVTVKDDAFREPVLVREVVVEDWREGIDLGDVEFRNSVITEDEAAIIRQHRLKRMIDILGEQGYTVYAPTDEDEEVQTSEETS